MITRRGAALFGAVVCQVPLLDMKRYAGLLAGASWMAEYGDPSKPEEWASLRGFSAYHRLKHDCLGQPEPAPPEGASVAKVEVAPPHLLPLPSCVRGHCPEPAFLGAGPPERTAPWAPACGYPPTAGH